MAFSTIVTILPALSTPTRAVICCEMTLRSSPGATKWLATSASTPSIAGMANTL